GLLPAKLVLDTVLQNGARLAHPGEFTQRAFLNGRIDLTQAEAVADLIHSRTELAMRAANEQLAGSLSRRINDLRDGMLATLGHDRAIVSPIPGTTRDTIEETASIRGLPVVFIDTAGLREGRDDIEVEGIRRSRATLEKAEIILHVLDASEPLAAADNQYLAEF